MNKTKSIRTCAWLLLNGRQLTLNCAPKNLRPIDLNRAQGFGPVHVVRVQVRVTVEGPDDGQERVTDPVIAGAASSLRANRRDGGRRPPGPVRWSGGSSPAPGRPRRGTVTGTVTDSDDG